MLPASSPVPDAAIKRGSAACGDSSELTRTRLRRYRMLAAGWVAVVVAAVGSGLLSPETTRPLPFAAMMLSVLTLGVVLARSEAGDRIALDREYVEDWSIAGDLEILCRTPLAVLRISQTH